MPGGPNKLSQFWQESKRRKVVRVITVYAAAAFVILQLVSIIVEPLKLPEWFLPMVIVLLCIGFIIAVILSWIYDIKPEGGIVTTGLAHKVKSEDKPISSSGWKIASYISFVVIVGLIVLNIIPLADRQEQTEIVEKSFVAKDPDGRISITVLPFENLTGDSLYYDWQAGVQNLLINSLSNSKEISVRQPETMSNILAGTASKNYTSITPSIGGEIALKLETNTFILGSILKAGNNIRIGAQLRDASTQEIYRSYKVDGDSEDQIFMIADSLSNLLMNFLEIKVIEKDAYVLAKSHSETNSAEAYKYYIQGQKMANSSEYAEAIKLYNKALDKDSSFVSALVWLTISYSNNRQLEQARLIQERTARYIDQAPLYEQLYYSFFKAFMDKDPQGSIKHAMRLTKEYPHVINTYYSLGYSYRFIQQYKKAADVFDQLLERMRQMDFEWPYIGVYTQAGLCYHELGQHAKEQEVYENGLRALPDHPMIIYRQGVCALSLGDTVKANKLISKYQSVGLEQDYSFSEIGDGIGNLYEEAEYFGKAKNHYQLAIEHEPTDNYTIRAMNDLAYLLVVNDLDINEGILLIDQALETNPTDLNLLVNIYHTKGWGLHKQGKNREALELLKKAWDLRQYYDHDHFLHIQEVEKALASQNQ